MSRDPHAGAAVPAQPSRDAERGPHTGATLALAFALGVLAAVMVWLLVSVAGTGTFPGAARSERSSSVLRASAESPAASPSPRHSLGPVEAVIDPPDLPRPPGSTVVTFEEGIEGDVRWSLFEYRTEADSLHDVRGHYRALLRDGGWLVGDVDYADGGWTLAASQGQREVQLDLLPSDGAVRTVLVVSDAVPPSVTTPSWPPLEGVAGADDDRDD